MENGKRYILVTKMCIRCASIRIGCASIRSGCTSNPHTKCASDAHLKCASDAHSKCTSNLHSKCASDTHSKCRSDAHSKCASDAQGIQQAKMRIFWCTGFFVCAFNAHFQTAFFQFIRYISELQLHIQINKYIHIHHM